jgi:hypothetical protein
VTVYVVASGVMVIAVYSRADLAHIHMRTVTGAYVLPVHLRDELPESVIEQYDGGFHDDDPTPVTERFEKP